MPDKTWEVLPPEPPHGETRSRPALGASGRLALAMAIAVASDLTSVWLEFVPPLQWALDFTTAGLLFLTLGRQWAILPALVAEAIPGVAMFPAWVLVVLAVATTGTIGRK